MAYPAINLFTNIQAAQQRNTIVNSKTHSGSAWEIRVTDTNKLVVHVHDIQGVGSQKDVWDLWVQSNVDPMYDVLRQIAPHMKPAPEARFIQVLNMILLQTTNEPDYGAVVDEFRRWDSNITFATFSANAPNYPFNYTRGQIIFRKRLLGAVRVFM